MTPQMKKEPGFARVLGRWDAVALVVSAMIGSGIYIVSADMMRQVGAPGLLLLAWIAAGIVTVLGALSFGELAAMFPHTGGQYVYLREGISPLAGYLYGWTTFTVIQTGAIAAVASACARFVAVFVPSLSAEVRAGCTVCLPSGNVALGLSAQRALAVALVVILTVINVRGVRVAARIQSALSAVKLAALFGVVLIGILVGRDAAALRENLAAGFLPAQGSLAAVAPALAASMVAALFSMDAWNNVGFTAGELKDPRRNVPFAMVTGVAVVTALYLLANVAYLCVLPASAIASVPEDRVATAVLEASLGKPGLYVMAAAIVVSTLGCTHGLILAGARVYYAMARDGLFFRVMGTLHARHRTPAVALAVQAAWASVLCLSGTYGELLDYVMLASLLFYVLTVIGLFALRARRPEIPRPVRVPGYPVLPALYVGLTALVAVALLVERPRHTWLGLAVVAMGAPVYAVWRVLDRRARRA